MSVVVASPKAGRRTVSPELEFVVPPPGMATLRRFVLDPLDEAGLLFALRSADDPAVRLFVVPPQPYFPDYAPRLGDEAARDLGLEDVEPVLLVVVHPGQDGHPPTANLLAPVVVNPATGACRQVVLDDDRWPLRAPFARPDAA